MRTLVSHGDGVWSTREEDEVLGEGEGTSFAGSLGGCELGVGRGWREKVYAYGRVRDSLLRRAGRMGGAAMTAVGCLKTQ